MRGGDHDANWPAAGDLAPDPDSSVDQPKVTIWLASLTGGVPVKIAEGEVDFYQVNLGLRELGMEATLTDNGLVYTARFRGGRNGFEYLLADLGIRQKNGHPWHPQTQGKI